LASRITSVVDLLFALAVAANQSPEGAAFYLSAGHFDSSFTNYQRKIAGSYARERRGGLAASR
jgi:hypothetical protein